MEQIKLMDMFMQLKYVKYSTNIINNVLYKTYPTYYVIYLSFHLIFII